MRIFIAGATGAVGLPLARALRTQGHQVIGMTRTGPGIDRLRELGAETSRADAFDTEGVLRAIEAAAPDVVIDQLTWLPASPADVLKSLPDDTRLRRDGGANLLAAAKAVGVRRYVMQSRGFYLDAPEGRLADENAKLRFGAPGEVGTSARVTGEYEELVLGAPSLDGVVLRYGFFCGPGTWYRPDGAVAAQLRKRESAILGEGNAVWSFVHIDDAVAATVAALTAEPGVYNVVDDDPLPVAEWLPAFARWIDAPEPRRVSREEALATAGEEAVYYHTRLSGASNARAKAKLGFRPRPLLWKRGRTCLVPPGGSTSVLPDPPAPLEKHGDSSGGAIGSGAQTHALLPDREEVRHDLLGARVVSHAREDARQVGVVLVARPRISFDADRIPEVVADFVAPLVELRFSRRKLLPHEPPCAARLGRARCDHAAAQARAAFATRLGGDAGDGEEPRLRPRIGTRGRCSVRSRRT